MKKLMVLFAIFLNTTAALAEVVCETSDNSTVLSDSGASYEIVGNALRNRCLTQSQDSSLCEKISCGAVSNFSEGQIFLASSSYKKCGSDRDCQGFANHCFAGNCTQPGYGCSSDSDCPGFANHCFARECTRQEPLCNSDRDCHGFANHCFAGKCTNP